MAIERLSDLVISQIAAGEVVERPASVIKELVENALDAGATTVLIDVQEGGRRLIRVSDDGTGISNAEVMMAVTRHATSKLRTVDDLYRIHTLGFRGEALASIVAVSRFNLVTRHRSEAVGSEIQLDGGQVNYQKAVGCPAGTVITVENLFFNTPARLKFLKTDNTEKRHIANMVMDYAMAYPQVRFVLVQDSREVFRTTGSGRLADVVVKAFGLDVFKQMIEIYGEETIRVGDKITVQGYTSLPDLNRTDRARIVLFVNGRAVQDSGLMYGITQAYHMLMERGRFPYTVLLVTVPPDFVDVNVHPTKAEVRFQDANLAFVAVQRSLRDTLLKTLRLTPPANRDDSPPVEPQMTTLTGSSPTQYPMGLNVPITARRREVLEVSDDDLAHIPEGAGRPTKPRTLPILRVVGQLGGLYIIAEGPAGLYLIDQNSAHECVLYDQIHDQRQQDEPLTSQEVIHTTITLTQAQMRLIEPFIEPLTRYGIVLEPFGNTTLLIRGIPQLVPAREATALVQRVILLLGQGGQFDDMVILAVAQTGAVKAGQTLGLDDMQAIIRHLERCPNPFTSPSGRQTLLHMSTEQLNHEFGKR